MPYPIEPGTQQPFISSGMTQEQLNQLIQAYQAAKQRLSKASMAYYRMSTAGQQVEPFSGAPVWTPPHTPGAREQLAQRDLANAQRQVSRLERLYPWLKEPAIEQPGGLEDYTYRYADRTGKPVEWVAKEIGAQRERQAALAAAAATTADLTPVQTTFQNRPWHVPGMTEEEEAYAKAGYFGMPTPFEQEQQDWQRRMWQAEMEQATASQKRAEEQAQWGRQMEIWENAYRQAQLAQQRWAEAMPWAIEPGREYKPGFQPGGPIAKFYEMAGMEYDPELYKPVYAPAPGNNLDALNMTLMQLAEGLGQGG